MFLDENDFLDAIGSVFRDDIKSKNDILKLLTIEDLIYANKDDKELLNGIKTEIVKDGLIPDKIKNEIGCKIDKILDEPDSAGEGIQKSNGILKEIHVKKLMILDAFQKINHAKKRFDRIKSVLDNQKNIPVDPEYVKVQIDILETLSSNIIHLKKFISEKNAEINEMSFNIDELNKGNIEVINKFTKVVDAGRSGSVKEMFDKPVVKGVMPCKNCVLRLECDFVDEEINRGMTQSTCFGKTWEDFDVD